MWKNFQNIIEVRYYKNIVMSIDNTFFLCFVYRKVLETIDQSEFEGFEYINPLLMSSEECV